MTKTQFPRLVKEIEGVGSVWQISRLDFAVKSVAAGQTEVYDSQVTERENKMEALFALAYQPTPSMVLAQ